MLLNLKHFCKRSTNIDFLKSHSRFVRNKRCFTTTTYNLSEKPKVPDDIGSNSLLYGEEVPLSQFDNEENILKIDTKSLRKGIHYSQNVDKSKKSKQTRLAKEIEDIITIRGPINIATFMRMALTHPKYGYYMNKDVFGTSGDFTTSPEISQMFGELLGLWCYSVWLRMDKPVDFQIIEIGPGRGTLMKDMYSSWYKYKDFTSSIHINFIEVSPHLRKMQAQKMGVAYPEDYSHINIDLEGGVQITGDTTKSVELKNDEQKNVNENVVTVKSVQGVPISWHDSIDTIEEGPVVIICQELFDALPIHQYVFKDNKWREKIINIDHENGPHWLRFELTGNEISIPRMISSGIKNPKEGDSIEVSPDSFILARKIANMIAKNGGASLIIDYGEDFPSRDTLRGIKSHEFVDVLSEPGETDLSAFIDFDLIRTATLDTDLVDKDISNFRDLSCYGPIPQGEFLVNLGIEARLAKLIRKSGNNNEIDALISSFLRLVEEDQMGKVYKVMTISNLINDNEHPDGFIPGRTKVSRPNLVKK